LHRDRVSIVLAPHGCGDTSIISDFMSYNGVAGIRRDAVLALAPTQRYGRIPVS